MKFNNNSGYVNLQAEGTEVAQAFSHFTYRCSHKRYIVVDVQGMLDGVNYLLTDPQIHSRSQEFGDGDHGVDGFRRYYGSHRCGDTCHRWQRWLNIRRSAGLPLQDMLSLGALRIGHG